jgi:hypothetical protein
LLSTTITTTRSVKRNCTSAPRTSRRAANVWRANKLRRKSRPTIESNIFRWYRSSWSRYTQVDPLATTTPDLYRDQRRAHEYAYSDENPIVSFDRDGLMCSTCSVCPSGVWTVDPFGQVGSFVIIGGVSVQKAHYTCRDNGYNIRIKTTCKLFGAMINAGVGLTGPGKACGCSVEQLINNGQTTKGWTASMGPVGIDVNSCTDFDPTATSGSLGKSWWFGGFARTWCKSQVVQ